MKMKDKEFRYFKEIIRLSIHCITRVVFFRRVVQLLVLECLLVTAPFAVYGYHRHLHHSLQADKLTLLLFKGTIVSDPQLKLANWNETVDVCNFTGVRCDLYHHRVRRLNLSNSELTGPLSPILSNLTALRILNLVANHFFGIIPPELFFLRHLHYVQLDTNNLHGSLPHSFPVLSKLTLMTIAENKLTGSIPPSLFSNCTALKVLDFSDNSFTGKFPEEIGNCAGLLSLNAFDNQFTGELPFSLSNTSLLNLDVENNSLSGELPGNILGKLSSLEFVHLSYNHMVSHDQNTNLAPFFAALANCTNLQELELAGMFLGGRLPSSIDQLSNKLNSMSLQENLIFGSVPPQIGNLSGLQVLNLTSNSLNETIPSEVSLLSSLQQLFLSHNLLAGGIPSSIFQLEHLGLLDLSNNLFSGEIPETIGNVVSISYMFLDHNFLSGTIPPSLGKCTKLNKLDLSYNNLTGNIPLEVLVGIRKIQIFLNLSNNDLKGPLPIELSNLENVQEIDVSFNKFTESIFSQISYCINLRVLNLAHNSLGGLLPDSLGELQNLESLDVSCNHLSGPIPVSLNKSQKLAFLNFSVNELEGPIPTGGIFSFITNLSFLQNPKLCGAVPGMNRCSNKDWFHSLTFLIVIVAIILSSVFLTTLCCMIWIRRMKAMVSPRDPTQTDQAEGPSTSEIMHNFPRITYRELSEATAGFDDQRLLGQGSYGRVYRGVLSDGTQIAVKVLQVQSGNSTKSFNRECQVLKRIRHRNLMRIITACSLPDFKALVLPYMANGSLDSCLYMHSETGLRSGSSDLTLILRVNICSDIAEGMAYLHHHSPVKVIHCDLKPSNVLLNDDMTALVSDFGIARLVMTVEGGIATAVENMGNSTANLLHGSIGYIPPEYGFGSDTSTKGDVYSFGVIVLEMVTRRRPTDEMFTGGLDLHKWVKIHYHGRVEKVIDSSLLRASRDEPPEVKKMWEVAIGELIELGILCTQDSPSMRPTMLDAADDLDRLKRYLSGDTTATFASSLGISSSTVGDDSSL